LYFFSLSPVKSGNSGRKNDSVCETGHAVLLDSYGSVSVDSFHLQNDTPELTVQKARGCGITRHGVVANWFPTTLTSHWVAPDMCQAGVQKIKGAGPSLLYTPKSSETTLKLFKVF
jgi:hypothetical protein